MPAFILMAYALGWAKKMTDVKLYYFSAAQYGVWFPFMSKTLIERVDALGVALRSMGYSLEISRVASDDPESKSQHNPVYWGEVRAIDLKVLLHGRVLNKAQLRQLYDRIRSLRLFTGIGVYPNWDTPGVHVDVREGRTVDAPATWGDVGTYDVAAGRWNHNYVSVESAVV